MDSVSPTLRPGAADPTVLGAHVETVRALAPLCERVGADPGWEPTLAQFLGTPREAARLLSRALLMGGRGASPEALAEVRAAFATALDTVNPVRPGYGVLLVEHVCPKCGAPMGCAGARLPRKFDLVATREHRDDEVPLVIVRAHPGVLDGELAIVLERTCSDCREY